MDWDAWFRSAGMEVGSHGWSHIPWRGLSPADARREFVDARTALAGEHGCRQSECDQDRQGDSQCNPNEAHSHASKSVAVNCNEVTEFRPAPVRPE